MFGAVIVVICIIGAIMLLPATGTTINMISLFAFIVTLGMVVDDAVIIGENVFMKIQKGVPRLEATISGFQGMHPRDIPSSCSNCRFYAREIKQHYTRRGRPDLAARLDEGSESGLCRRRPPEAQVGFPRVRPETWCGEWEA